MAATYANLPRLARAAAYLYRRSGVDLDDLYQEAYLAMCETVKHVGTSDEGWLMNSARNALRDLIRAERRESARRIPDATYSQSDEEMVSNLPDADQHARPPGLAAINESALAARGPGPVGEAQNNELREIIFARLPHRQAGAVYMHYWYGMTDAEIGTHMSISQDAAESLRRRGEEALKEILRPRDGK